MQQRIYLGLIFSPTIGGVVIHVAATVGATADIVAVNFEAAAYVGASWLWKIADGVSLQKYKLTNSISRTRPFCYLLVNRGLERSGHLFLSRSDFSVVIVKTVRKPRGKFR